MSTTFMDDEDSGSSVFSDSEPEEIDANHHIPVNVRPLCYKGHAFRSSKFVHSRILVNNVALKLLRQVSG